MLTLPEKILFAVAVIVSLYFTYTTFNRMVKVIQRGQGQLPLNQLPHRLKTGLVKLVNQGNILRHRPLASFVHFFIAWGFLYYILINIVDVLKAYIPNFHFLGDTLTGNLYRLLADTLTIAVLAAMIFFLLRRFVAKDRALRYRPTIKLHPQAAPGMATDSLIVGGFILGHVGFHFLSVTFLVALRGPDNWQPFATLAANLWSRLPPAALETGWHVSWWLAVGLILVFLPYFPYSKHAHLFMGPLNFMLRPPNEPLGTLQPLDFEDETIEQFGAAHLTDLDRTQIVDAFSCIMCNRCQDTCPAYQTGKELSPAALEINKRIYIREHMDALAAGEEDSHPLLEYAISESALWACTACGACIDVCPVGNEPMVDILGIRQDQVLMNSAFPDNFKNAFNGLERNGNPWQSTEDRLAWTHGLDFPVPTVAENPDFEVLFWVGCAGAFDPNNRNVTQSIAAILHKAGVNFAVLGNQESCTGDVARRSGNEYLFFEMAQNNIQILDAAGVDQKKIVTGCPHCLHTLGNDYADFGGHYTVLHHTQLIADLVGRGHLSLNKNEPGQITYHDPCYLGRFNNEYDAPRALLAQSGMNVWEMEHNRRNSLCCGAGGGQMWKEEEAGAQAVKTRRFAQAQSTQAEILAVACPFCSTMLNDANTEAGSPLQIKDIAEIVAVS